MHTRHIDLARQAACWPEPRRRPAGRRPAGHRARSGARRPAQRGARGGGAAGVGGAVVTQFKPGDRVRCVDDTFSILESGKDYVVEETDDDEEDGGPCLFLASIPEHQNGWFASRFVLAEPAACVPDDQQTYAQRREEIARRRNPQAVQTAACDHSQLDSDWWICFICGQSGQRDRRGDYIGRAVDRLSQREPRLGCHAWRP